MLFSHFAHHQQEWLSLPAGDPTFPALAYICEPSLAMVSGVEMEMSYWFTQSLFIPGYCKVLFSGVFNFFSTCSSKLHFHTPKMPGLSQHLPDDYYTLNYNCTVREFSFLMVCQCVPFQKIISIEVSSLGRKQSRQMQAAPSSGQLIWTRYPVRG